MLSGLFICLITNAQQTELTQGSIAVVGLSLDLSNSRQKLAILTLEDLPTNTITFTDRPWISGSGFVPQANNGSDGFFEWKPDVVIPKGTVVIFEVIFQPGSLVSDSVVAMVRGTRRGTCTVYNDFVWGNSAANTDTKEDQIFAFTNTFENPTLLWGISTTGWTFDSNITRRSFTSDLPLILKNSRCHNALGAIDNAYFSNGAIPKSELYILGTSEALKERLNKPFLFAPSSSSIESFPTYYFVINNTQPPLVGSTFSTWNFNNGTYANSLGLYPIQRTQNLNTGAFNVRMYIKRDDLSIPDLSSPAIVTEDYPLFFTSPPNWAGIIIPGNTTGYNNIKLSFNLLLNRWAANSIVIQQSTNGGANWAEINITNINDISFYSPNTSLNQLPVLEVYPGNTLKFTINKDTIGNTGWMTVQIACPPVTAGNNVLYRIVTDADPATGRFAATYYNGIYSPSRESIFFDDIQLRGTPTTSSNSLTSNSADNVSNTLTITPSLVESHNSINISHNAAQKGAMISIIEAQTGRTLLTQSIARGSQQTTISVANLPTGNYIVTLIDGSKKASGKFRKQ